MNPEGSPSVASTVPEGFQNNAVSNSLEAKSDLELLRFYAAHGSEEAFTLLVKRHSGLVYSTALRQVNNSHLAEEITQSVFLTLVRKASAIREGTVLAGWLFRTTCYTAANALTMKQRRWQYEQAASESQDLLMSHAEQETIWEQLKPSLNEALESLGTVDRNALLLRFFEGKSLDEIADALQMSNEAARKRIARGIEKLRILFKKRGVTIGSSAIIGILGSCGIPSAPMAVQSRMIDLILHGSKGTSADDLSQYVLRKYIWRKVAVLMCAGMAVASLIMVTGSAVRQARIKRQAALSQSIQETLRKIDASFSLGNAPELLALINFRNSQDELFRPILSNYVHASAGFRAEFGKAFPDWPIRIRAWELMVQELFAGQPTNNVASITPTSASVTFILPQFQMKLVNIDGTWRWDLFSNLSVAERERRRNVLNEKSALLEALAKGISERYATNGDKIIEMLENSSATYLK